MKNFLCMLILNVCSIKILFFHCYFSPWLKKCLKIKFVLYLLHVDIYTFNIYTIILKLLFTEFSNFTEIVAFDLQLFISSKRNSHGIRINFTRNFYS